MTMQNSGKNSMQFNDEDNKQKPLSDLNFPLRLGYTDGLFGTAGQATESADCTPTMGDVQEWWQEYREGYEAGEADRMDYDPLLVPVVGVTEEGSELQWIYVYMMDDDAPHTDDGYQLVRIRVLEDGLVEGDEVGWPLWLDVTEITIPEIRQLVEDRFGITLTKEVA